jgi:hypothetical protein
MSGRTIGAMGMLAVVLGVSLLVVPAALADSPQDYPSVTATQVSVRPDDLPGLRGPGALAVEPTVSATNAGFDWTDAAIGGAVVLGVVLLAGLAVRTATHHGPTAGRHAPT